jgi:hypothetical protein
MAVAESKLSPWMVRSGSSKSQIGKQHYPATRRSSAGLAATVRQLVSVFATRSR